MSTTTTIDIDASDIAMRTVRMITSASNPKMFKEVANRPLVFQLVRHLSRKARSTNDIRAEQFAHDHNKYILRGDGGSFAIINLEPIKK